MPNKLYEIISRVMNVPIINIDDNSNEESIEAWDSFSLFVLLDEIETEFNVKFTLEQTLNIKNVRDFKKCLEDHGVNVND